MKTGIIALTIFFALISLVGVGVSMPLVHAGEMTSCPLMSGAASICQMNVLEHLSYWQQLFVATTSTNIVLISILLLLLIFLGPIFQKDEAGQSRLSLKTYKRNNPQDHLFNYLIQLFSRGILHPKVY